MKSIVIPAAGALLLAAFLAGQENTGKTKEARANEFPARNSLGDWPPSTLGEPVTFTGLLVDGGCRDRSQANLTSAPLPLANAAETEAELAAGNAQRGETGFAGNGTEPHSAGITAFGIHVDPETLAREQAGALEHQAPDLLSRQPDESCGITAETQGFALLLDNGRLLNLDGGGATLAWQTVQSTDAGKAMMSGKGAGIKLRVVITGQVDASQLNVKSLSLR
jgi:hypothetical protein